MKQVRLILIISFLPLVIPNLGYAVLLPKPLDGSMASCPAIDKSKRADFGQDGKTRDWDNCSGTFTSDMSLEFDPSLSGETSDAVTNKEIFAAHDNDKGRQTIQRKYRLERGASLSGVWKNGLIHGHGTYIHGDGYVYSGEFKEGVYDGLGNLQTSNGKVYQGIFKNGVFVTETDAETVLHSLREKSIKIEKKNNIAENLFTGTNKLPSCPNPDFSKNTDIERFAKWSNCWGKYKVEIDKNHKGDILEGEWFNGRLHGQGVYTYANGIKHIGAYKNGNKDGMGTYTHPSGDKYVGEFKDDKFHGQGTITKADGKSFEGIWENNNFVREAKVNPLPLNNNVATNTDRIDIDRERQKLAEERKRLEEERRQREQAKASSPISLQVSATKPTADGAYTISIQTNADTASLKINGEEIGGRADGRYTINRIARAGQDTKLEIIATDIYNNFDFKTITVARPALPASSKIITLKPETIKIVPARDAVAIIIGIQNYKRVPKAEFANNDAREFNEYAIRALGIKPENIKMLVDEDADEVNIVKAFENWLPIQVNKDKTDVYVFYSGHGLPAPDGKSLYFLPHGVDKELLSRTAVAQNEILAALTAAKPKSVTMFIDACYSGQTRGGDVLIADAKPVSLKSDANAYPHNFTVITASTSDQISSSSSDLKHGIFSFYLMKGMEGDADVNQDGKITVGEMQEYLSDKVARQATTLGRKQNTQMVGDANRVLVGR